MQVLLLPLLVALHLSGSAAATDEHGQQECADDCAAEAWTASLEEQAGPDELVELQALRTELLQKGVHHSRREAHRTPAEMLITALAQAYPAAEYPFGDVVAPLPNGSAAAANGSAAANGTRSHPVDVEHGPPLHAHAEHKKGKDESYLTQAAIPVSAFILGAVILMAGHRTAGLLTIYFGAQSGFSLYMKVMLSNAMVSKELHLKGVPAAFLVTAIQQVVAFAILAVVLLVLMVTPKEWLGMSETYQPKRLRTSGEWFAMLVFSVAFAMNIGLNNFSLSLLTVSLNLIIRSCLPLVTLIVQVLSGTTGGKVKPSEVVLMCAGVFFAGMATLAKGHGSHGGGGTHLVLGVIMCSLSDIAAAGNLVLASVFGTQMKLNPLDTTFYMAVPCAISLLPAVFFLQHPAWAGSGNMTDWGVFLKVMELEPSVLILVGLSGLFAVAYNLLQYSLVQSLSATHAAFAGNFNKAATIMLSLCLGLEALPNGAWAGLMMVAILGNIASFTGYSLIKAGEGKGAHGAAAPLEKGGSAEGQKA